MAIGIVSLVLGGLLLLAWILPAFLEAPAFADTPWLYPFAVPYILLRARPLLILALGAFLLYMGYVFVRRTPVPKPPSHAPGAAASSTEERLMEPVPVPPEDIELREGTVRACLRCGSTRVVPQTLSAGLAVGAESLVWVCDRCGFQGQALVFDNPTAYREFVRALHTQPAADAPGPEGPR